MAEQLQPPYMSYGVLEKTLEIFKEVTVPSGALDRRVLNQFSGADYGALISGLRFLCLVNEKRVATEEFKKLVEASKDPAKFKEAWKRIIDAVYHPIVGDLNIKSGTAAELERAFKAYGVSAGQMLTKTIRFYIKAVSETGVQVSPYMTAPKPRAARTSNAGRKNSTGQADRKPPRGGTEGTYPEELPSGFERLPIPGVPNSFIQYPANLTEAHCQILQGMVGVLLMSIKARTGGKDKTA
jgi:hypothetical protein